MASARLTRFKFLFWCMDCGCLQGSLFLMSLVAGARLSGSERSLFAQGSARSLFVLGWREPLFSSLPFCWRLSAVLRWAEGGSNLLCLLALRGVSHELQLAKKNLKLQAIKRLLETYQTQIARVQFQKDL